MIMNIGDVRVALVGASTRIEPPNATMATAPWLVGDSVHARAGVRSKLERALRLGARGGTRTTRARPSTGYPARAGGLARSPRAVPATPSSALAQWRESGEEP
jgi:hypothetical protein